MAHDRNYFLVDIFSQSALLHLINLTVFSTTFSIKPDRKATERLTVQPAWPWQPHFLVPNSSKAPNATPHTVIRRATQSATTIQSPDFRMVSLIIQSGTQYPAKRTNVCW